MVRLVIIFCLLGFAASAQTYSTRSSDIRLDAEGVSSAILGYDLEFFDGGISRYSPGGSYSWTYSADNGGESWFGVHSIGPGGTVCIDFRTLRSRCDMFVQSGARLVLLTEDGQRFPVRDIR